MQRWTIDTIFVSLFFHLSDVTGIVVGIASRLQMKKYGKITLNIVLLLHSLSTHFPLLYVTLFKQDKEPMEVTSRFPSPTSPHPTRSSKIGQGSTLENTDRNNLALAGKCIVKVYQLFFTSSFHDPEDWQSPLAYLFW